MKNRFHAFASALLLLTAGCIPELHDPIPTPERDTSAAVAVFDTLFQLGGVGERALEGISLASNGTPYIVGSYQGSISTSGLSAEDAPSLDPFFLTLNEMAQAAAFVSTPSPEPQLAHSVVLDDANTSVFVVGEMSGQMLAGNGSLQSAGGRDAYVLRYGVDGSVMDAASFGGTGFQAASKVARGGNGGIFVGGVFSGSTALSQPVESNGGYDVFVMGLDSTLSTLHTLTIGGSGNETIAGLVTTMDGKAWAIGDFEGDISIGKDRTLSAQGLRDVFIVGLSGSGSPMFERTLPGNGMRSAGGIDTDGEGNLLIAGSFTGSLEVEPSPLLTGAKQGLFVAKLDPTGEKILWARGFGEQDATIEARGIATDALGRSTIVADYRGTLRIGALKFESNGDSTDVFVLQLDAEGNALRAASYGDAMPQRASGVAVDGIGRAHIIGFFMGTLHGGTKPLSDNGDAFLLRLGAP